MSHTYHKIWLQFVWSTKDRSPIITKKLKTKLIKHFKEYGSKNEIYIDIVNGIEDHLHFLIGLNPKQSPAKIANLLKGESSNWVNKNIFIRAKFSWQEGYSVFSVSPKDINKVREYIRNQEEHHRKMTYLEEVEKFLKAYGIQK